MSKKTGASVSKLCKLHELLTDMFIEEIEMCRSECIPMSGSDKNVIVTFLKNNDISATPDAEGMDKLQEEFEELSDARRAKTNAIFKQVQEAEQGGIGSYLN